jgi:hypothetical protein
MKTIKFIISAVQAVLIGAYILFYNIQFYWSLKSALQNFISLIF